MNQLILHLNKEWYYKIGTGEKTVEYREYKPYWIDRISYDLKEVIFCYGYNSGNDSDFKADVAKVHVVHRRNLPEDVKEFFKDSKWDLYFAIEFKNVRYAN